eukprot:Clim_evm23s246 gene=Clim_evmTU23s246
MAGSTTDASYSRLSQTSVSRDQGAYPLPCKSRKGRSKVFLWVATDVNEKWVSEWQAYYTSRIGITNKWKDADLIIANDPNARDLDAIWTSKEYSDGRAHIFSHLLLFDQLHKQRDSHMDPLAPAPLEPYILTKDPAEVYHNPYRPARNFVPVQSIEYQSFAQAAGLMEYQRHKETAANSAARGKGDHDAMVKEKREAALERKRLYVEELRERRRLKEMGATATVQASVPFTAMKQISTQRTVLKLPPNNLEPSGGIKLERREQPVDDSKSIGDYVRPQQIPLPEKTKIRTVYDDEFLPILMVADVEQVFPGSDIAVQEVARMGRE